MEDLVRKAFGMRISVMAVLAALAALALSSSAVAQVTVGQIAPTGSLTNNCGVTNEYDELQPAVAAGPSYVVPAPGTISSWSTNAGGSGGQLLTFKVFRPVGPGTFQVAGHDGPRLLTPGILNTFETSIPVQSGDIIGLFVPKGPPIICGFETGLSADVLAYKLGNAADGATIATEQESGSRLNVSATVLPPPVLTSISPAGGSIKGGTSVLISGGNFARVTGVSFGSTPAQTVTVGTEGQITAVTPPSASLTKVPVTVTTIAGVATSAQTFAYEGCLVPKLKGTKLKASKRKATNADCKIGKVKKKHGATAKTGKVVKQNPQPGKLLPPGTKIKITLDD
jgi:hypothetical protein